MDPRSESRSEGRFRGKVALVSGGGSGIGQGIAVELAREGCDVIINDLPPPSAAPAGTAAGGKAPADSAAVGEKRARPEDEDVGGGDAGGGSAAAAVAAVATAVADGAQKTAAMVRAMGRRALVCYADVSDRAAVEEMIRTAVGAFGHIDVLIPCAYFSHRAPFLDIDPALLAKTFDVTCFGTFHLMQLCARQMVVQGTGGKVVIIGSVMSKYPQTISTSTCYNAAKAALDSMTRTVATELAQHRINVNLIRPGWILTDGERQFSSEADILKGHAVLPLGMGLPADIAKGVCYLASSDADYVTGTTLDIDGGFGLATRIPGLHAPIACAKNPVHEPLL